MRLDRHLVEHCGFETRARAQAAIAAGRVRVDGAVISKPAFKIAPGARVEAEPAHPYVSRAALKLAAALDAFAISPAGRICLDVGASTGGFTQVLLERGAARVIAVDVGRDQLHPALRGDARVRSLEACDARSLTAGSLGAPPELIVCDASFIGLEKVLPAPLGLAAPQARLVALFKPQFQVGRAHVGKGGLVSDPDAVARAAEAVERFLAEAGWAVEGWIDSPIPGGDGNRERLLCARRR